MIARTARRPGKLGPSRYLVRPEKLELWRDFGRALSVDQITRLQERHEMVDFLDGANWSPYEAGFREAVILVGSQELAEFKPNGIDGKVIRFRDC